MARWKIKVANDQSDEKVINFSLSVFIILTPNSFLLMFKQFATEIDSASVGQHHNELTYARFLPVAV
jgi:hypothetical protein